MASAKKFLGNKCMTNKKFLTKAKTGTKLKVAEVAEKEDQYNNDEILGIRFKEFEGWLRLNATNLEQLAGKFGDDTDDWAGKTVMVTSVLKEVDGKEHQQVILSPM